MNLRNLAIVVLPLLVFSSCNESTEPVVVTERRELTSYDTDGNLHVTMPSDWRRVPSTKFRDFNCKFGKDGEVYISIASGDMKENAERWLKQFGDQSSVDLSELEKLTVLGAMGVIIEAEGTFQGMRGKSQEDAALLGLLVNSYGNLITVKMVAGADEVEAQRENFMDFCKSIRWEDEV